MSSLPNNSQPKENRTLHGLIALCVLLFAQINLFVHPEDAPANTAKTAKARAIAQPLKNLPTAPMEDRDRDTLDIALADNSTVCTDATSDIQPLTTAFELAKEGNQYLNKRAQGKLVQMSSAKTENGLMPREWHAVYFDDEAKSKAVEVRFSDGEMTRVFEPRRFLQFFSRSARKPMEEALLKIDSDEALAIALRRTGLTEETAERSEFKLEAENGLPVWKINFWGRVQHRETNLGEVIISANDGSIVKNRIKASPVPDRLTQVDSKVLPEKRF